MFQNAVNSMVSSLANIFVTENTLQEGELVLA